MDSDKHLALHEQTTQLAQQAGAHPEEQSITKHVTPPNSEGQQHRISVTADPNIESVDIQVTSTPHETPFSRPDAHITSVQSPVTTGFAGRVKTSAGEYQAASNQDAQIAVVHREGYGRVELKNPKAAEVIASLAVKKTAQAIDTITPVKPKPKQGLLKRVLTRS